MLARQNPMRSDRQIAKATRGAVFTLTFCCLAVADAGQVAGLPATSAPSAPVPSTIPLGEIATRAAELPGLLRALTPPPDGRVQHVESRLSDTRQRLDAELAAAADILRGEPTMDTLQAEQELWQKRRLETSQWLTLLTQRAKALQDGLDRLQHVEDAWRETRDTAAANAPETLLAQIESSLASIATTRQTLEAQRANLLSLQSSVAKEVERSADMLTQFTRAEEVVVEGIFGRQDSPIWSAEAWTRARSTLPALIRKTVTGRLRDIAAYVGDPEGMPLHAGILASLVLAMRGIRRRVDQWARLPDGVSPAMIVFERPVASAIVIALLLVAGPRTGFPPPIRSLFIVIALCAVIPLMRLTADLRLVPEIYALGALFAVDSMREFTSEAAVLEQTLLVLQTLAGILVLALSPTIGVFRGGSTSGSETRSLEKYRAIARVLISLLSAALIASALGYLRLGRLVTSGVLATCALAVMLYASVHVLTGLAAFAFRVWPLRALRMVNHHRDLLERRVRLVLSWLALGFWVFRVVSYIGLLPLTWSLAETALGMRFGRGPIQVTVGDILDFVLTVWVAYLLSAFIRFALREDVYPRAWPTRGLSYAVSSLVNYIIIALGFVLALSALGMDLSKVTVLAGAFGVGIGFGLQSVVNNFVSGLILLFERPVHVGDVVEIGDRLTGEVSRIGIRASTVRTGQGAEIIVPNAQLITERVTNWTLSDRTRRIDLRLGVDYGSAPERVLEVLEAVGRAHTQVLKSPAPQAFFVEFADSAITFELRVWCLFDGSGRVQTELAVAAYAALRQAGMSMPFPQREVRLLGTPPVDLPVQPAGPSPATVS